MKSNAYILLLILLLGSTASCSSDDDNSSNPQDPSSDFFIKSDIDGEERIFNFENFLSAEMATFAINDLYTLTITGSIPGGSESISINLNSFTPIEVGLYDDPETLPTGFLHALIGYNNAELSEESGFVTNMNAPVSSLQITEITENTIAGTFSGIVQNPLDNSDLTISNGEFFLELIIYNE